MPQEIAQIAEDLIRSQGTISEKLLDNDDLQIEAASKWVYDTLKKLGRSGQF